jgi:hypothetical protein
MLYIIYSPPLARHCAALIPTINFLSFFLCYFIFTRPPELATEPSLNPQGNFVACPQQQQQHNNRNQNNILYTNTNTNTNTPRAHQPPTTTTTTTSRSKPKTIHSYMKLPWH